MGQCITVLKGSGQYHVLNRAAEEISKGFSEYFDLPVIQIDMADDEAVFDWKKAVDCGEITPLFVFDMQGTSLTTIEEDETAFAWELSVPIFAWIFDHPEYHASRIQNLKKDNIVLGCINRSDTDYVREFYNPVARVHFLAHGGFIANGKQIPFPEKIPAVFFAGTYETPQESEEALYAIPNAYRQLVVRCRERFLSESSEKKAWHLILRRMIEEMNFELSKKEEEIVFNYLFPIMDKYHRSLIRTDVISALLDAQIPVAVTGKGWHKFYHKNRGLLTVLSDHGITVDEMISLMSQFQMILNLSDTLSQGGHERIPTAMLNGSICLTNVSTYLSENFEDRQDILFFYPDDLQTLVDQVIWVWKHPAQAEKLAQKAYEKALAYDMWHHRAKEILEIMKKEYNLI